jgi:phospholipid-binding lipoprotein MlaA
LKKLSFYFSNVNAVLQLKPKAAVKTTGRFLINTTMGICGLFDVATKMRIIDKEEDFGQTLGRYGIGNGAYLVLSIYN